MSQILKPSQNLRIDRLLAYNVLDFNSYYPKDSALLKDLIVYISFKKQTDLFGFTDFDLDEFCQVMKWNKSVLRRTRKDAKFFEVNNHLTRNELMVLEKQSANKDFSLNRVWDRVIENAFFILQHHRFYYNSEFKGVDSIGVALKSFVYLKEIRVSKTKKGKINYSYQITDEFKLLRDIYFVSIDFNTYVKYIELKLSSFYLNLMYRINLVQSLKSSVSKIEYGFIELAKLMNISVESYENANVDSVKRRQFSVLKGKINKKWKKDFLPYIGSGVLGLGLDWVVSVKGGSKNRPFFTWVLPSDEVLKENTIALRRDVFLTNLFKSLSVSFQLEYCSSEQDVVKVTKLFLNWLFSNKDKKVKISTYITNYSTYLGFKGVDTKVNSEASQFFSNLSVIGGLNAKHYFMSYDDGNYHFKNPILMRDMVYTDLREFVYNVEGCYLKIIDTYPE